MISDLARKPAYSVGFRADSRLGQTDETSLRGLRRDLVAGSPWSSRRWGPALSVLLLVEQRRSMGFSAADWFGLPR
jgi:hypothetical protein